MGFRNTGNKGFGRLREINEQTGEPTGVTKVNDPADPDYIAPVYDPKYCEPGDIFIDLDRYSTSINSGSTSITIQVYANNAWEAFTPHPSLSAPFGSTGMNDGTLTISVDENTGADRTITFEVVSDIDPEVKRVFTINQSGVVQSTPVRLARSFSGGSSCDNYASGFTSTYYIDTDDFLSATKLYKNPSGTDLAISGYYSNGSASRYWNGTSFSDTIQLCRFSLKQQ